MFKYIKDIQNYFKKIDKRLINIMKKGLKFSMFFILVSVFVLSLYSSNGMLDAFYIGLSLLKSSEVIAIMFIICGFVFK